jgi:hypothetical protein
VKLLRIANGKIHSRLDPPGGSSPGGLHGSSEQRTWGAKHGLSSEDAEVYNYISAYRDADASMPATGAATASPARPEAASPPMAAMDADSDEVLRQYYSSCGLSEEFTAAVTDEYHEIIGSPGQAIELFEGLVRFILHSYYDASSREVDNHPYTPGDC